MQYIQAQDQIHLAIYKYNSFILCKATTFNKKITTVRILIQSFISILNYKEFVRLNLRICKLYLLTTQHNSFRVG